MAKPIAGFWRDGSWIANVWNETTQSYERIEDYQPIDAPTQERIAKATSAQAKALAVRIVLEGRYIYG